jgi:hypothetical protein
LASLTFFPRSAWTGKTPLAAGPSSEDWSVLMLKARTMLISGERDATDAFIHAAAPSLLTPVSRYACETRLPLPRPAGTVIFDNVEALDPEQQEALIRWMDEGHPAPAQVIAVTSAALYARVQAGLFLSSLYYRLNALYVEVGGV